MSTKNNQDSTIRRPIDQIEKQLSDLTKVKQMAEEYGERDFASRAALKSIREHERELQEELAAARAAEKRMPRVENV